MRWRKRFHAWMLSKANAGYEPFVADRKRTMFAGLQGVVLEIGPGTGVNLRYYPSGIRWIGIEPNPYMHAYIKEEAQRSGLSIELRILEAEKLKMDENSVDAVIGTLVLCSIPAPQIALREIVRVLKPSGRFLFIEHVAAPNGTRLRLLQRWVRPVWKIIGDGCHPDRETWKTLEEAGFKYLKYEHFRVPVPLASPHIAGVATKDSNA